MVDGAWAVYRALALPPPSPSRLIARGAVPADHLSFFREHYGIPSDVSVRVSYANLPNPGHVVVNSRRSFEIALSSSYKGWHDAEAAVLAHEMTHVVMKVHGFRSSDRFMEEVYTDSFAVFLGSCLLSNFSESVDFYASTAVSMRLGYLDPQERAYAVALFLAAARLPLPSKPSGSWRRSDLVGLTEVMSTVEARSAAAERPPKPPHRICPRCAEKTEELEGVVQCGLCLAAWKRGFWGWRSAPPAPSSLRAFGLTAPVVGTAA